MLIVCLPLGLGLGGCGQKGPLYLPDPNAPAKQTKSRPAAPAPAAASSPADAAAQP
mgnify:CR=1 FL=1